jgi:hypothetical protein
MILSRREWITDHDRRQFASDGYMVVRGVIPTDLTCHAVDDIAAFVGADLADSATWYNGVPELDGVVPLHHAQSLWDIRQCPSLYEVFKEFFGTPQLIVDINRCIFRPPVRAGFPTLRQATVGDIHWDTDPRVPGPESLQAVVLLTEVGRDGGGFQCLPEIFQNLEPWLEQHARRDDFDFYSPGLNHWKATQIEGKAGDVILWSTKLPHGSAINLLGRPRVASFVTMQPNDDPQYRESLKTWWMTKRAPDQWRGLPGQLDPEPGAPAVLSELGLKLIGVLPW